MIALLSGLWSRAWGCVVAAGAAIALVAGIFLAGRRAGEDKAAVRQQQADSDQREKFDAIDGQPVDFDAAISRLRDRSKR